MQICKHFDTQEKNKFMTALLNKVLQLAKTVSEHAQYLDPNTDISKWNAAIIFAVTAACKHLVILEHLVSTLVSSTRSSSASSSVRPGGRGLAAFPTAPSTGTSDRVSALSTTRPLLGEFRLISGERQKETQGGDGIKGREGLEDRVKNRRSREAATNTHLNQFNC